jgi:hypothetical protein
MMHGGTSPVRKSSRTGAKKELMDARGAALRGRRSRERFGAQAAGVSKA